LLFTCSVEVDVGWLRAAVPGEHVARPASSSADLEEVEETRLGALDVHLDGGQSQPVPASRRHTPRAVRVGRVRLRVAGRRHRHPAAGAGPNVHTARALGTTCTRRRRRRTEMTVLNSEFKQDGNRRLVLR